MRFAITPFIVSVLFFAPGVGAQDYVWWEAEKPDKTNFPAHSAFDAANYPGASDKLSGGSWLTASGKRGPDELFASYDPTVPKDGTYEFWVRKFWQFGPFKWRFDEQPWQTCDAHAGLADDTPLGHYVNANWVRLGTAKLSAGRHTFEMRLLAGAGEDIGCGFDCFLLNSGPFVPNGKHKPGERIGKANAGYFPFEPETDRFTSAAILDLRGLNEKQAGQTGPVRRAGDHFTLGDGRPVRFWAVNVSPGNSNQDRGSVDYLAAKLAKLGVNMVRFHGSLFTHDDPTRIDPAQLDNFMYLVSAMKRQGIYTYLSVYFPLWIDASNPKLALSGFDQLKSKTPFALLYFDPRMQEIYRGWLRQLLTTPDPYSNLTLAQNPALAIVEGVNEDSFFFWTFGKANIPAEKWTDLENHFTQAMVARYGSVSAAVAAWDNAHQPTDTTDHLALFEAWGMTADGIRTLHAGKRVADQIRFLATTQRDWYAGNARFLKDELHYAGLFNPGNWITADAHQTGAVERWTYVGDMADQHGYFNAPDTGPGSDYSVAPGHTFTSAASVLDPAAVPLRFHRTANEPMIMTELGWTNPNRDRADGVFLSAAYGSLQRADGLFFFAIGSNFVRDSTLSKFGVCSPTVAGAFPAAALIYRRGDIAPGEIVERQVISDELLFSGKGSPVWSGNALDEFRKKDLPAKRQTADVENDIDGLAPYIGRVERAFSADRAVAQKSQSLHRDLASFIDRSRKTVSSTTGQLRWDWGTGIAQINSPRAQGAAGFLSRAGEIKLADITLKSGNEFGAIFVVALDDQPLSTSRKILIQATTQEEPLGFKTTSAGKGAETITDMGSAPMGVKRIDATVRFVNQTSLFTLQPLDENGYASGKPRAIKASDATALCPETIYQILTRL